MALKIEEREAEPVPVVVEFEGVVMDARPGDVGTVLTLSDGATLQIRTATEVVSADDDSPASVEALMDALDGGREVIVRGTGYLVQEQPLVLDGKRVVVQSEPAPPALDVVVGLADFVNAGGSVILIDGTAVVLSGATEVVAGDANSPASIAELVAMLDQNRRVQVTSEGTLDGPQQINAVRVVLTAMVGSFDLEVVAVDPFAPGLILEDGSFVLVPESASLSAVGDGPAELWEVDGALMSGQRVRARGVGYLTGQPNPPEPDAREAIEVQFELIGS